ncbi:hypothetical protein GCM10020256_55570 [Streptomyces thermocoprophilus]
MREGDILLMSAPYGDLVLADAPDAPVLLASAGIGVTPMIAMLAQLAADGHRAPVTVVHGDRSPADHALRTEHETWTHKLPDASLHLWYEQDAPAGARTGYVDLAGIDVPAGTHAYLCGPLPFMRSVREQLLARGVAPGPYPLRGLRPRPLAGPGLTDVPERRSARPWAAPAQRTLGSPRSSGPVGSVTRSARVIGSRVA